MIDLGIIITFFSKLKVKIISEFMQQRRILNTKKIGENVRFQIGTMYYLTLKIPQTLRSLRQSLN